MSTAVATTCGTCGMACTPGEFHPYAACLMYRGCHSAATVRANLAPLVEFHKGRAQALAVALHALESYVRDTAHHNAPQAAAARRALQSYFDAGGSLARPERALEARG